MLDGKPNKNAAERFLLNVRGDTSRKTIWMNLLFAYLMLYPVQDRPPIVDGGFMRTLIPEEIKPVLKRMISGTDREFEPALDGLSSWLIETALHDGITGPLVIENAIEYIAQMENERGPHGGYI